MMSDINFDGTDVYTSRDLIVMLIWTISGNTNIGVDKLTSDRIRKHTKDYIYEQRWRSNVFRIVTKDC